MPEEISQVSGAQETHADSVDSATPAIEETPVDARIQEVLGEHNAPKPEKQPEATHSVKEEEMIQGKQEEPEKPAEAEKLKEGETDIRTQQSIEQISRLDRRLAKLYLSNKLLQGDEGDLPSLEQVATEIRSYPLSEKTQALKRLLAENRTLRGGQGNQSHDDGQVEFSQEDQEALIEAEADRRLQEMQSEIRQRDWQEDLVRTVEAHPELDERTKEYNPRIAAAVERLVNNGMKTSDAYETVTGAITQAQETQSQARQATETINRQSALSGSVSASPKTAEPKKITWEEVARIQIEEPDRYMEMVRKGELPEE